MNTSVAENKTKAVNENRDAGSGMFFKPVINLGRDRSRPVPTTLKDSFFKPVITPVVQRSPVKMIQRVSGDESPRYEDAERKEEALNVQAKQAGDTVIQRLSARQSSGGRDLIASNVAPWQGSEPTGDDYNVYTDGGTAVPAWVAVNFQQEAHRYWCHGHSLGTYRQWLYSVYSGTPLQRTITDEYNNIPEAGVQSGDIAVWEPSYGHSCKIESVALNGAAIDASHTNVSTKNGPNPLANTSLSNVMQQYRRLNSAVNYYRHR
ncbi:MAG: hypothetical protein JWQ09_4805 [Segetibacter sp.]|nr:hypothetical protein [Segetibacter sp.]